MKYLLSLSVLMLASHVTGQGIKMITTTPTMNPDPDRTKEYKWLERHKQVLMENRRNPVGMIFIGDSITHYFGGHPKAKYVRGGDTWEKYYGHRNAVNMGFGWDRTQHILWRLQNGEIDGISPKVTIVMAGINNILSGDGAAEIAAGIKKILECVRLKLPNTKILLVGILPFSKNQKDKRREKIKAVNAQISTLADDKHIYFIDVGHLFLTPKGSTSKKLLGDYLHPNRKGYAVYAKAIEPLVSKLIEDKRI